MEIHLKNYIPTFLKWFSAFVVFERKFLFSVVYVLFHFIYMFCLTNYSCNDNGYSFDYLLKNIERNQIKSTDVTNLNRPLQNCLNKQTLLHSLSYHSKFNYENNENKFLNIDFGGNHYPKNCLVNERLAIIIPYRNRHMQLMQLLKRLHQFLTIQKRYYTIFVVEQAYDDIFNKGKLMNSGTNEILKLKPIYNCFIYHDVDMIPIDIRNIYSCGDNPRHLSPSLDEMRFQLIYDRLVGGVLALNRNQLNRTNGFSNEYWGWGAEDDDMSNRILKAGYAIDRPKLHFGRYEMMLHHKRPKAKSRIELIKLWEKRWYTDGLSNIEMLGYQLLSIQKTFLYTNLTFDIGKSPGLLIEDFYVAPLRIWAVVIFTIVSVFMFSYI